MGIVRVVRVSFSVLIGLSAFAVLTRAAAPAVMVADIPSPAPATATSAGSTIAVGPQGVAWLTWLETDARKTTSVRFAKFDPAQKRWSAPQTIARGENLHAGGADFPALTVGADGRATVLWYVTNPASADTAHLHHGAGYHAVTSSTRDGGRTWSPPAKVARESDITEFTALTTLADGRVLAVWLDARVKKALGAHAAHAGIKPAQQLYSRILDSDAPDTLIDARVCDCCHTTLTAFPDGTALLAYRGRGDEEQRDIHVTRFRGDRWEQPRPLHRDDWRINGCPVNGPQIASDGGRVAAAWFTASDNDPRVLASFSSDAGGRFLMPLRLSEAKPAGRVSTLLLHDAAMLVSWVDATGALAVRRVTPDYGLSPTVQLTRPDQVRIKGFPRLALLRDYAGGDSSAQVLATFTSEEPATIRTMLITVPEGAFLEAGSDCGCAPTADQLQGFPLRGRVVAFDPARRIVTVKHPEIAGVFAAGEREFGVAAKLPDSALQPGREFLGRFDRRDGGWQLLEIRLIASPQP